MTIGKETVGMSFKNPTPKWATMLFRVIFLLTTATTIIIASDADIPDKFKAKAFVYMKAFDFVVWGFAKSLGVKKKEFEDDEQG